ncbi:uncharacterized protein LOC144006779 [Festucalex cinctus]
MDALENALATVTNNLIPGYADATASASAEILDTNIAQLVCDAQQGSLTHEDMAQILSRLMVNLVARWKLSDHELEQVKSVLTAEQQIHAQVSSKLTELEAWLHESDRVDLGNQVTKLTQELKVSTRTARTHEQNWHNATSEIRELKECIAELSNQHIEAHWIDLQTEREFDKYLLALANDEIAELTQKIRLLKNERIEGKRQTFRLKSELMAMEEKLRRLQHPSFNTGRDDESSHAEPKLQQVPQGNTRCPLTPSQTTALEVPVQDLSQVNSPLHFDPLVVHAPVPLSDAATLSDVQQTSAANLGPASQPPVPLPVPTRSMASTSPSAAQHTRGPPPSAVSLRGASSPVSVLPPRSTLLVLAPPLGATPSCASPVAANLPSPAQQADASSPHHVAQPGMSTKELDTIAKHIQKFQPKQDCSDNTSVYLKDLDFHLRRFPQATTEDKIYLMKLTSTREVSDWIDRQPIHILNDYRALCHALSREFDAPVSAMSFLAAWSVKQGRKESPSLYYSRLRKAYFGHRNEPNMEEQVEFKTLFLNNLHPNTSRLLGVTTCPRTLSNLELRELASKAFVFLRENAAKSVESSVYHVAGGSDEVERQSESQQSDDDIAASPSNPAQRPQNGSHQKHQYGRSAPARLSHSSSRGCEREKPFAKTKPRKKKPPRTNSPQEPPSTSGDSSIDSNIWTKVLDGLRKLSNDSQLTAINEPEVSDNTVLSVQLDPAPSLPSASSPVTESNQPFKQVLGNLKIKGASRKFYLRTTLEQTLDYDALVDPGADITVMSNTLFNQLQAMLKNSGRTLRVNHCSLEIGAFALTNTHLDSMATLHWTIGPHKLVHPRRRFHTKKPRNFEFMVESVPGPKNL